MIADGEEDEDDKNKKKSGKKSKRKKSKGPRGRQMSRNLQDRDASKERSKTAGDKSAK